MFIPDWQSNKKLKMRVIEGKYDLQNYPYDYNLSNIKHLGELHVNEQGQPELDEKGREQYKITISANTGVLWDGNFNHKVAPDFNNLKMPEGSGGYGASDYFRVEEGMIIELSYRCECVFFDNKKKAILIQVIGAGAQFTVPKKAVYARVISYNTFGKKDNAYVKIKGTTNNLKEANKTTILLPCQLMKVGDIADKLY